MMNCFLCVDVDFLLLLLLGSLDEMELDPGLLSVGVVLRHERKRN